MTNLINNNQNAVEDYKRTVNRTMFNAITNYISKNTQQEKSPTKSKKSRSPKKSKSPKKEDKLQQEEMNI